MEVLTSSLPLPQNATGRLAAAAGIRAVIGADDVELADEDTPSPEVAESAVGFLKLRAEEVPTAPKTKISTTLKELTCYAKANIIIIVIGVDKRQSSIAQHYRGCTCESEISQMNKMKD